MNRRRLSGWASRVGVLLASVSLLIAPATPVAQAAGVQIIPPTAPTSQTFGKTYGEWSAAWWQFVFATPVPSSPIFDETGAKCGVQESGPVFFLFGVINTSGTATRDCTVPAGRALFFPVLNVESDNVGICEPNPPLMDPCATVEQLRGFSKGFMDSATGLHASIDGVEVPNLSTYRVATPVFDYTLPVNNNLYQFFGINISGKISPAVGEGVFLMLAPLSPGSHTITFGGTSGGFTLTVTYHLHVA